MMYIVEEIGESFLELKEVSEFKEEFERLNSLADYKNLFYYNFFHFSLEDKNQFESFLTASLYFFKSFPENALPILKMIKDYCFPLALKINFILWVLNHYYYDDKVIQLINLPYSHIFNQYDENCHRDNLELKNIFNDFFPEDNNIFDLILNLRDSFHDSDKFKKFIELSKSKNEEFEYYEKALKSYFYIVKEIIFEIILFNKIVEIDRNNILKLKESNSAEGSLFDIKLIDCSIKNFRIVKIRINDNLKFGVIRSKTTNVSPKKSTIIRIKGEYINNGVFGKYSKNMEFYSQNFDRLNNFDFFPNLI